MMQVMATEPLIGTTIKKRRQALGMNQEQFAERVGVHRSSVANWERGASFPLRHLGAVEEVLGISLTSGGQRQATIIPPDLVRRLERLTPDERAYVVGLLTQPDGVAPGEQAQG